MERKLRIAYVKNANLSHAARAFLNVVKSMAEHGGRFSYKTEAAGAA
jgi:hypothetical protein